MLTREQLDHYEEQGYVVLNDLFSREEVRLLQEDAEMLATPERGHPDANVIEKDGVTLRAAWAPEIDSPACAAACRLPRILGPVRQILGDDVYLYQSRLNFKRPRSGDLFQWHQDYQAWKMDRVPRGDHHDILTVLIMLDDTTEESGPLQFIPGSHRHGHIEPYYDTETTSYPLYMVDDQTMARLFPDDPVFKCTGPAGTVVIFAATLVHSSEKNRSPYGRRNLYFAYSRDDNRPGAPSGRALANAFIQNPYPDVLRPIDDSALAVLAR